MPKLSVIIPVYGVEKYIERCVRSLFKQTLDDIEYIFVDDCSLDRSVSILKEIIEEYHPFFAEKQWTYRIERLPKNNGQAAVRRYGIALATGDYVIHCDSDDWTDAHMYEEMYCKAVTEDLDIVVCDYFKTDGEHHTLYKNGVKSDFDWEDYFRQLLTYRCTTSLWTKMVKRHLYSRPDFMYPKENMWEDYVFSIQLFYFAKRIGYVPKPLYYYYINPQSICNINIDSRQVQLQHNCRLILQFLQAKNLMEKYQHQILFFKYMSRSEVVRFTKEKKYLTLWRSTFPEVNRLFWTCPEFSLREKVKFVAIYLGLYNYLLIKRKPS